MGPRCGVLLISALLLSLASGVRQTSAAENAPQQAAPAKPSLDFVFEQTLNLGKRISVGKTALGTRNIVPIIGGTFEGPNFKGTILPGAWDWQLVRADGCVEIKVDYMLRTDDGVIINVVNKGVVCPPKNGGPTNPLRTTPVFEPPLGKYEWLGQSAFIGALEPVTGGGPLTSIKFRFYRVR